MIVVSKKQTINLTKGKCYKVIFEPYYKDDGRYKIISDRNIIITSSVNNFLTIHESRDLIIDDILSESK